MYTEMRIVEVIYLPMFTVLPGWGSLSRDGISLHLWIHCLLTQERSLWPHHRPELTHSCGPETRHKHAPPLGWLGPRTLRMTGYVLVTSVSGIGFVPSSVLSRVRLFATPWTAARQAFLSITNSQSLLKLMSIKSVMASNHLILYRPLLLSSIFPSIRVKWVSSSHQVAKVLEFQLQHQSFQWIFTTDSL